MRIVICSSMSFSKEMVDVEKQLLDLGHEVVLPKYTHEYANGTIPMETQSESMQNKIDDDLIRGYYKKIKDADAVLIFNLDKKGIRGYIGGNAFLEMGFAYVLHKKVFLYNDIPEMSYVDELRAMQPFILNGDVGLIK